MVEKRQPLRLEHVVRQLRHGCPWNAKQTPENLVGAIYDELSELKEAISLGISKDISYEIGDVLFNIISLVEYYNERGILSLEDVDQNESNKMIYRHPYVFNGTPDPGPDKAFKMWSETKIKEKNIRESNMLGVSINVRLKIGHQSNFMNDQENIVRIFDEFSREIGIGNSRVKKQITRKKSSSVPTTYLERRSGASFLVMHLFPSFGVVLLHGFSDGHIDAGAVRKRLTADFETDDIEVVLLEREHGDARLPE